MTRAHCGKPAAVACPGGSDWRNGGPVVVHACACGAEVRVEGKR